MTRIENRRQMRVEMSKNKTIVCAAGVRTMRNGVKISRGCQRCVMCSNWIGEKKRRGGGRRGGVYGVSSELRLTFIDNNNIPLYGRQSSAQPPPINRLPVRHHAGLGCCYHYLHLVPLHVLPRHIPELVLTDLCPVLLASLVQHSIHV
jgi:hypothetical protein